jgi:plastocyanin
MNDWLKLGVATIVAIVFATAVVFAAGTQTIVQSGRAFHPDQITIGAGDTLNFTNQDEFIHQIYVKSDALNVDTDEKAPGETVDITFPARGTFEVHCHIHPKMRLVVTVK